MFFAEEHDTPDYGIHYWRSEAARPSHTQIRIVPDADEIEVGLAINLTAAQHKRIDAPLMRAIEKLAAPVGEEIILLTTKNADAHILLR